MSKYLSVLDIFRKRCQNKVPEWYWKHIMQFFSHLPDRIFLIICIPLDGDIGHILAQTACRNDFSFSIYWGKGAKIGVRIGTESLLSDFFNLAHWIFLIFSKLLEPNTGYIYAESAFLRTSGSWHFGQKGPKIYVFEYFLKLDSWYYAKKPYFCSIYTCPWVLCPVLNFFHLQDRSYSV